MRHSHKLFIILCMMGTGLSAPAGAEDVPPAVQVLLDTFERQTQVEPEYESIETGDDGSITISKLTLDRPAAGGEPSITVRVDELVLSEISDEGDGLYEIGSAEFTNINGDVSNEAFAITFEIPEVSAEDWYVVDADDDPAPEDALVANTTIARKIVAGKMKVAVMGQSFTIDGFQSDWDGDPETGAGTSTMKISNIAIPEQAIAMVDQTGMLRQLGYKGLSFDIESNSKLEIADGKIGMSASARFSGRDIGAFKLGLTIAEVPLALYAELQSAQQGGKQQDPSALLAQAQGVTLSDFSLRFEDASITAKLLPVLAAMQGMDEAALVANAGAMAQMGLMQLQNQAFTEQTVAAVDAFLKEPKSLSVTANPASPLKVSDVMAMDPAAPGEIISKLGLSVTAND